MQSIETKNDNTIQPLTRSEGSNFLMNVGIDRSKKVIELDGRKLSNKHEFYRAMVHKFQFPEDFAEKCNEEQFIANMRNIKPDEKITSYTLYINNIHKKADDLIREYITVLFNDELLPYFSEKGIDFNVLWVE